MSLFLIYKLMKDSLNTKKHDNVMEFSKQSKRICTKCFEEIKACKMNGKELTKRQAYNYLKARSIDGKIRCKACMIKWLEMKIDELI